jgi:hypothetical protein
MKFAEHKNFISLLSILLVVFLFAPSIVKISHALYEHKNIECTVVGELHIHEVELDCDFQDFNLSPVYTSPLVMIPIPLDTRTSNKITSHYTFLSKYQNLHFALRAPPIAS